MTTVVPFPLDRRAAMPPRVQDGAAQIFILPVIRVERHGDAPMGMGPADVSRPPLPFSFFLTGNR
ncbi:hypothetical protein DFO45_3459 [Azorhizobium sp. AG788]|uniref:hypothetical protein n=1 Tax=Azorhizobium sp. AG788 TaxID=2183897 RepID=UPI00105BEBDC|nr:hypothetical protein [Azorhizobium sp. AG788]TDT92698.1 hypothetical protein DFO45_3459 [Azorhizobium sp. AG788]